MASLSFIMDVNDDHPSDSRLPPNNKRDKGADNLTRAGQLHDAPSNPQADPSNVSSPGLATTEAQDINQAAPAGHTRRRGAPSRGQKSAAATSQGGKGSSTGGAATVSSSSSSSPSLSAPTTRQSTRRRSTTTSNDSMDRSRYGPAPSSLSMGRSLQRPMPMHPAAAQFTPKITPKTKRISKAKKGLPVHVCEICKPPKTFTRAEHLRRHQLGHGEPRFQCSGCDRSFHRADLLARHQQKHEHDGEEGVSKPGSAQQSPHPSPAAPPSFQAKHSPQTPAPASRASPQATEISPAPHAAAGNQPSFSHGSNASYRDTSGAAAQEFNSRYHHTPTLTIVSPAQSSSLAGSYPGSLGEYHSRNGPPSIYVVTQGLELPSVQQTELPDLHDASPWPSSASDSTYSTPVSDVSRNPRTWTRGHRSPTGDWASSQRLSPYPSSASRAPQSSGQTIEGIPAVQPPLYMNSYSNHQPSEQTYGSTLNVPSSVGYSAAGTGHHHAPLSPSSYNSARPHQHRHSHSVSSARSRTPPLSTSSHGHEALLVSAPGLSGHLDSMASIDRRKEILMETHQDLLGSHGAMGALDVLDGLAVAGYGASSGAASPGADNASHSSGIIAELDLALGGGCAMPAPLSMTIPLPGPVLAAIPRYLEIYWSQVDPVLPLIHRQSFEAAPEDVLKCAMAAVATQHLDNREDRTRGNQLHEFAWQEVKRVPQWSLQTMQAILLCEYFARFRGRKAVTRPSKPFESLYSRVLYHLDHTMIATDQHLSVQERWHSWIDAESRRRLLAACVFSDGHAAIYQQQRRAQDGDALQLVPLIGRSAKLWEASSAEEWVNTMAADPSALQPEYVPPLEHITAEDIMQRPQIDRMIILSVLASRLPRRQRSLPATSLSANSSPAPEMDPLMHHAGSPFHPNQPTSFPGHQHHHHRSPSDASDPFDAEERISTLYAACPVANTYLALHHTPLRDLLAVGGDSWVFTQKILPATSYHEHQKRLRVWVNSATTTSNPGSSTTSSGSLAGLSVVRATVYAARAILGYLDRQLPPSHTSPAAAAAACGQQQHPPQGCGVGARNPAAPWSMDMSDYWGLYVCALICWAFCHHSGRTASGGGGGTAGVGTPAGGGGGSAGGSPVPGHIGAGTASSSASRPGSGISVSAAGDEEAVGWLRMVAAEGVRLEDVVRVRGRREAVGVVGLVRRKLESDCLGGRSRLYVDAVGVLRRLEERAGWKLF